VSREKVAIAVLSVLLLATSVNTISMSSRLGRLEGEYAEAQQTIVRQSQLLVDLRKESVYSNFNDFEELTSWVDWWVKNKKPSIVSLLLKTAHGNYWDCDDFAEGMQRDALRDKYLMSVCIVGSGGRVYGVKVTPYEGHAGCLAIAGNGFYFIEPQTGVVTPITQRD